MGFVILIGSATALASDGYIAADLKEDASLPWMAVLYAVVVMAGVMTVAFKNSKRTHLD